MEHNKDIADIQAAEATSQKKKKFILCYHSFSVLNYKRASVQIRKIADAAGSPISIAVIPSFGAAPESEAEEFREEIEKFVDEGYEIMLHGARHRADLSLKRSISGKIALWISNNEAEFAGIDERFTQALLKRSLALWKAHGTGEASGFIPPIWFGNKYLKKLALDIFDYYEDFHGIYQMVDGKITAFLNVSIGNVSGRSTGSVLRGPSPSSTGMMLTSAPDGIRYSFKSVISGKYNYNSSN
jgi:predicted deacetylase